MGVVRACQDESIAGSDGGYGGASLRLETGDGRDPEDAVIVPDWLWKGEANNTLYVSSPAHQQADVIPVSPGLVEDVLDSAYEVAAANGGQLHQRLLVVIDEAANIAPPRELPCYASTCASHAIQLLNVWQDVAQIRERFGCSAETVVNNHTTEVILMNSSGSAPVSSTARLGLK
jgi:hypothetical protein